MILFILRLSSLSFYQDDSFPKVSFIFPHLMSCCCGRETRVLIREEGANPRLPTATPFLHNTTVAPTQPHSACPRGHLSAQCFPLIFNFHFLFSPISSSSQHNTTQPDFGTPSSVEILYCTTLAPIQIGICRPVSFSRCYVWSKG